LRDVKDLSQKVQESSLTTVRMAKCAVLTL
jgi:hypothetical protein